MKNAEEKFFKELKMLRMDTAEREHVREALFVHMQKHTVDKDALLRRMLRGGATFHAKAPRRLWKMQFAPALASVVLLAGLGGVSYAAEGAVPGDALYSVKVHINETVRTAMAISPEQRVVWETTRVTRRIEEAEALAARGELTQENSTLLSNRVAEHSAALTASLLEAEESEDAATAGDMKAEAALALEGHDDLLLGIVASAMSSVQGDDMSADDVSLIVEAIRATAASLDDTQEDVQESLTTDGISEGVDSKESTAEIIVLAKNQYARAEERVAESRAYLVENRDKIGELTALQASRIVRRAEESLHLGELHLEWREYPPATDDFREAQRLAQRAILLVEANIRLAIEVVIEPEEVIEEVDDMADEVIVEETDDVADATGPDEEPGDENQSSEEEPTEEPTDPSATF